MHLSILDPTAPAEPFANGQKPSDTEEYSVDLAVVAVSEHLVMSLEGNAVCRFVYSCRNLAPDRAEERLFLIFFYLAAVLFLANFALGVAVQTGLVDTKPFRWLHHALFFLVFVSAALAALVGFVYGAPYRWPLLAVLVLFAVLPYVRAGTFGHAALACCALVFYAAGFFQIL